MKVAIHQPEHLVWLGFLFKVSACQTFVILDHVQFTKNNFQNRNKIRTNNGFTWLSVPIKKHHLNTPIKDIEISYDLQWEKKYLNLIKINYENTPYFYKYFPEIEKIINKKYKFLIDLNIDLLNFAFSVFDIKPKEIIRSSGLPIDNELKKTEAIISICKSINASEYLAGEGSRDYLNEQMFIENNIKLSFVDFMHPVYTQNQDSFLPGMSFLDYLFNIGPKLPWKK